MKRGFALALALALMLCAAGACAATLATEKQNTYVYPTGGSGPVYVIEFERAKFVGGQQLPVYSGPGKEYYRAAGGYAKCNTDEEIYIAGKEGTWALVLYWRSNGGTRTGYVDLSQLQYTYKTSDMDFAYRKAKITKDCAMTDDPTLVKENLAYLSAGEYVTLLAYYTDHHEWAYVEAMAGNVPLRGFVLKDCVSLE